MENLTSFAAQSRRDAIKSIATLVAEAFFIGKGIETLAVDHVNLPIDHINLPINHEDSETVNSSAEINKEQFRGAHGEYLILEEGYKDALLVSGTSKSCPEASAGCKVQYFVRRRTDDGPITEVSVMFTVTPKLDKEADSDIEFDHHTRNYCFNGEIERGKFFLYDSLDSAIQAGKEEEINSMIHSGKKPEIKAWFEDVYGFDSVIESNLLIFKKMIDKMAKLGKPEIEKGYNPLQAECEARSAD